MKPVPDAEVQRAYRVRITLFLIAALRSISFWSLSIEA